MKFKETKGLQKTIKVSPRNPDRVIGTFHGEAPSREYVKARHYLTKILALLFKENIPQIHMSSTHPHRIEVDRKNWDKDHTEMQRIIRWGQRLGLVGFSYFIIAVLGTNEKFINDPKTQEFLGKILTINRSFRTSEDLVAGHNYTKEKGGNPIYLDSFEPWNYENKRPLMLGFDLTVLREEIDKLPEEEKKVAMSSLDRIMVLWNEERSKFDKKKEPQT